MQRVPQIRLSPEPPIAARWISTVRRALASARRDRAWRLRVLGTRVLRSVLPPLVIVAPATFWLTQAIYRSLYTPLGLDQADFQYTAWAVHRGLRLYRDIRDFNGPVITEIHLFYQLLGGGDEARFRVLDCISNTSIYFVLGLSLPTLASKRARGVPLSERVAWGAATAVYLLCRYYTIWYWDIAQRETYFDLGLMLSLALQFEAQHRWRGGAADKVSLALLLCAGIVGVTPVFGKPTWVVFLPLQLAGVLLDGPRASPRWRGGLSFVGGTLLGAAAQIVFVLVRGDLRGLYQSWAGFVPHVYHFMWMRPAVGLLFDDQTMVWAPIYMVSSCAMLGLIAYGAFPARGLVIALAPMAAQAQFVLQAKGSTYHYQPVVMLTELQLLVLGAWAIPVVQRTIRPSHIGGALAIGMATVLSARAIDTIRTSGYLTDMWLNTLHDRKPGYDESPDFRRRFNANQWFPSDNRAVAEFLRSSLGPDDRVQIYGGFNFYILFLAQRLPATAYTVMDVNVDQAAANPFATDKDREFMAAYAHDNAERFYRALLDHPPKAFVLEDRTPHGSPPDALEDMQKHCPSVAQWMQSNYALKLTVGDQRVWLRR
jgi:hypothetical protein